MNMQDYRNPLFVGESVPDFTLDTYEPTLEDFSRFDLAQAKADGRWTILFFYPADFTFVWATEFAALAEQHIRFKKMGADLVTVSTDTKFTHLAWRRHEGELRNVAYSMGADPTGRLGRLFGVYNDHTGLTHRGTFLIDPTGRLVMSEVSAENIGRNIDELMRKFKAALYVSRKTTEACPSKWKDDESRTIAPSARMVGRVHEALEEGAVGV